MTLQTVSAFSPSSAMGQVKAIHYSRVDVDHPALAMVDLLVAIVRYNYVFLALAATDHFLYVGSLLDRQIYPVFIATQSLLQGLNRVSLRQLWS